MKADGEKWAMLWAHDMHTAEIFDEAGIPVLLVGDSAGNNVYGFETTVPVTVDHLVPLCRAVTSAAKHAMVVADLPFGSHQASPQQALATATRFMKEGLAHAVKLEGGKAMVPEVELLVRAGIPVMGHIGFTLRASTFWAVIGSRARRLRPTHDRRRRRPPGGGVLRDRHGDGAVAAGQGGHRAPRHPDDRDRGRPGL